MFLSHQVYLVGVMFVGSLYASQRYFYGALIYVACMLVALLVDERAGRSVDFAFLFWGSFVSVAFYYISAAWAASRPGTRSNRD